ncbi:hypothetical protein D6D06_02484 [Aureobasidium pullulans]|nr:hypothetical protein D6D06_02484 [Aureobasidium pullulans]
MPDRREEQRPNASATPLPDPLRTFWVPPFPDDIHGAVNREHPPLRLGDYNPTSGLYIWQKERFGRGVGKDYESRTRYALTCMWYGVENSPRCVCCEKRDLCCTSMGLRSKATTCARCRLVYDTCSFSSGSRSKQSLSAPREQPFPTASSDTDRQPNDGSPAKRLRSSEPKVSSPGLASQERLNVCETIEEDHLKRRPRSRSTHDIIVVAGPSNGNKHRRHVVEIPDSPPATPSAVSVADKQHPESATTHTECSSTAFDKFLSEMEYLKTRIQKLEVEMKPNKGIKSERLKDFEARIQQYGKTLRDLMQNDRALIETQMQVKRDRIEARIKEDQGIFEARLQGYKEVTEAQDLKLCSQLGEIRNLKERLRYSVNTILLTQKSEDLHDGETPRGAVKRGSDNPTEEQVR